MGAVCNVGLCDDEPELQVEEEEEEPPPDPPMPGRWTSSRGNQHVIGVDVVQWASGEVTQLRKLQQRRSKKKKFRECSEWAIDMKGERFTVKFDNEGRLCWSDGDIWTRDMRAPETGTYAAVSGALVRATESFHDALSATPGALSNVVSGTPDALSSAASYVTSPLTGFVGIGSFGGSTAASPVGTAQEVKHVKFATPDSPSSQATMSPMGRTMSGSPVATMDERRANMQQATSPLPTMQAPLQTVHSGQLVPTQVLAGGPYGTPQPQYMHTLAQQQSAPTQYQLPQQTPAPQVQMQAGPPVYPESLSPSGPRPKRRVAPSPSPSY